MKLEFLVDRSPRLKGDVAEFNTRDEIRTAEWYLANGMAKVYEPCKCEDDTEKKCSECEELAKKNSKVEVIQTVKEVVKPTPKAKPTPKKK